MMRPSFVVTCTFLLFALVAHADGNAALKKQLLGRWQPAEEKTMQIEFRGDGSLAVFLTGKTDVVATGKYKWVDATTIDVALDKETKSDRIQVAITGDTLSTTDSKGKLEKFTRVK
jgi:uncharacterized protein (TIGR03066 family)